MFLELEDLINREIDYVITFPINGFIRKIEINLNQYLLPEPAGLYNNYWLEPILDLNQTYYYYINNMFEQIPNLLQEYNNDFNNLKQNKISIYNKDYKMIIHHNQLNNLSKKCYYPYSAIKVAYCYIDYLISSLVSYKRENLLTSTGHYYLTSDLTLQQVQYTIEDISKEILGYLFSIEKNHNRIYEIRNATQPFLLNVIRSLDWRAYEFEKQLLLSKYNNSANFNL